MQFCDVGRDLAGQRVTKDGVGKLAARCGPGETEGQWHQDAPFPQPGHLFLAVLGLKAQEAPGSPTSQRKRYENLLKVTLMCVCIFVILKFVLPMVEILKFLLRKV